MPHLSTVPTSLHITGNYYCTSGYKSRFFLFLKFGDGWGIVLRGMLGLKKLWSHSDIHINLKRLGFQWHGCLGF